MRLVRNELSSGRWKFRLSSEADRLTMDYQATERLPSPNLQGRMTWEFGSVEFRRCDQEHFTCMFHLCPMNMYDGGEAEFTSRLHIVERLPVNGLVVKASADGVEREARLLVDPTDVSEEGWFFSFREGVGLGLGDNKYPVRASDLLTDITLAESVEFSVAQITGNSTKMLFTISCNNLDEWRLSFVRAFGRDLLVSLAASRGLKLQD